MRFSQKTSISISFLLCIALDIPSDISNKARENSLTLSLFLCLLPYNYLFSCALLRVSPNVVKSNMNILSTESFSSSGAYLTSSRAGPLRCAIRKGNLSAAGTEGKRLRASSIQSCSSQERPVNALRVRFGGAATVTLIDCWLLDEPVCPPPSPGLLVLSPFFIGSPGSFPLRIPLLIPLVSKSNDRYLYIQRVY